MGRKKTSGLYLRGGFWHIDKVIRGIRLCESTGTNDLREAEEILARRVDQTRQASIFGIRPERTFRQAATKFLMENQHLASISDYAGHLKQLDGYIGDLPLVKVHRGALEPFIKARQKAGRKSKTINLAMGTVRHILNLAADEWMDEHGLTWLERAPKIKLLPTHDERQPYPLDWEEQAHLLHALPEYLRDMALFEVNTGTREQEVCKLRWRWEIDVPELGTSVFLIPKHSVKNREERLVVLNEVAKDVVENQRGRHSEFVFTSRGNPLSSMNNTKWQRGRIRAALDWAVAQRILAEPVEEISEGRYESLVWRINGQRTDRRRVDTVAYTMDDYDAERVSAGLDPIKGSRVKDYDTKQIMRYKALRRFVAQFCPEVRELAGVRVHDLKHTFGRRLRAARVHLETRKVLLGHTNGDITTHYSAAELEELLEAANRVCGGKSRKTPALVVLKRKTG